MDSEALRRGRVWGEIGDRGRGQGGGRDERQGEGAIYVLTDGYHTRIKRFMCVRHATHPRTGWADMGCQGNGIKAQISHF